MTGDIWNSLWFSSSSYPQDITTIVMTTTFIGFFSILLLFYVVSSSEVRGFTTAVSPQQQQKQKQTAFATTRTLSSNLSEMTRRMSEMIEKEWNDLAPPFRILDTRPSPPTALGKSTSNAEEILSQDYSNDEDDNDEDVDVTHFCFLVHGHKGYAKDLSYIEQIMRQLWTQRRKKEKEKQTLLEDVAVVDSNIPAIDDKVETGSEKKQPKEEEQHLPLLPTSRLVVHNVECNEKKTDDGVANGGNRLLDEMLSVIRHEMHKKKTNEKPKDDDNEAKGDDHENRRVCDITISMVGNSLGGIYSRYAIAKLAELATQEDPDNNQKAINDATNSTDTTSFFLTMNGQAYRLHFNVFCTTASPHLGISKHTYLPLPRPAEIGVARVLGTTGHDLFRLNDLMKEMATSSKFLNPLSAFRKRVAYANAFRTDFPVPAETAAFLHDQSRYPHHFAVEEKEGESDDYDSLVVDDSGLIIATLHTPRKTRFHDGNDAGGADHEEDQESYTMPPLDAENTDELIHMSTALDSLGWKKVFVDLRRHSPSVDIPSIPDISPSLAKITTKAGSITSFFRNNSSSSNDQNNDTGNGNANGTMVAKAANDSSAVVSNGSCQEEESGAGNDQQQDQQQCPVQSLREKQIVESKDVMAAFRDPIDKRFSLPIGHNMICAFSRGRLSTYLNKGGRPVMDTLAKELVEDIFTWSTPELQ